MYVCSYEAKKGSWSAKTFNVRFTKRRHYSCCITALWDFWEFQGFQDEIPGVRYRTSPKGCMDGITCKKWLKDDKVFLPKHSGRPVVLFVDNCSSCVENEDVKNHLRCTRVILKKFPKNATDLVQPADSFVIQKIKDEWRRLWDLHRLQCVSEERFNDRLNPKGSGKLENPVKDFFYTWQEML